MKKTDEYYQALEVCNNAKDYHNIDVMVARTYVRAYDEAINYNRCCTELKAEKEAISFEDWKKRHIIDRNHFDNTFLHDTEGWIEEHILIDKYNIEVMSL